jgi:hypothetical protein
MSSDVPCRFADKTNYRADPVMPSMRHVQTENVRARANQGLNHFPRLRGGPERGNDLCFSYQAPATVGEASAGSSLNEH